MKKGILQVAILIFAAITATAQAPQSFNYQGIARNTTGEPLGNTTIGLRLTILDGSALGTNVYEETFKPTTNAYGLFTVSVGGGTPVSGSFNAINWGGGSKYLEVEIDPTGGTSYTVAGTNQLLSVPYALYAANSSSGTGSVTSVTAGSGLSGGTITTSGTISMPNVGIPGTYGSGTQVPVITTDAEGRVTGITNTTITAGGTGTVTNLNTTAPLTGGPITSTGTIGMATSGVTAGSYGTPLTVPQITVDNYGRVTSAADVPIAAGGIGTVTNVATAAGQLTGGPITTTGTLGLATVGSPGMYGSATQVPQITTDAYGRVTNVTPLTIAAGVTTINTATGQLTGGPITTSGTIGLATTAVTAGVYGTGTQVPQITVDAYGRITSATTVNVVPSVTGTANYIPMFTSATALGNSAIYQNGTNIGMGTLGIPAPGALVDAETTTDSMAGWFRTSTTTPPTPQHGIVEADYAGPTNQGVAIFGNAYNSTGNNNTYGVQGYGTVVGVEADAINLVVVGGGVKGSESSGYGNDAFSVGAAGYGNGNGGTPGQSIGVVGNAIGGTVNYSGYFVGDVYIGGTLSGSGKLFKIDDPLDPANKYLVHSCIESDEMMNIYSGNVTTDASGNATVTLPAYFEALNKDFRYQLTVIGTFAQAIISEKVHDNKFSIKTNTPNVEVSWQVSGVRHDTYANAHPIVPEVEKESFNKGRYLDAKDLGKDETQMIGYEFSKPTGQKPAHTTTENTNK